MGQVEPEVDTQKELLASIVEGSLHVQRFRTNLKLPTVFTVTGEMATFEAKLQTILGRSFDKVSATLATIAIADEEKPQLARMRELADRTSQRSR